jgi:hypothetical protein
VHEDVLLLVRPRCRRHMLGSHLLRRMLLRACRGMGVEVGGWVGSFAFLVGSMLHCAPQQQ